jgi:hypothetical protein
MVICRRSAESNGGSVVRLTASPRVVEPSLVKRAPQFAQNLDPATLLWAHSRQRMGRATPQLLQNRLTSETSAVQPGHCIASPQSNGRSDRKIHNKRRSENRTLDFNNLRVALT